MEKLKFTLAEIEDLSCVFNVFKDAIKEMNKNNIDQWDELYPDKGIIAEDIEKRQLYMSRIEGEIASIYVLNQECDEEYKNGNWQYPDAEYYVIHRLCVNPKFQNKGIGKLTLQYIENELKQKGVETIRLDTYTLNPYALKMYDKSGYSKTGTVHWRKGEFYLMEKSI